MEKEVGIMKSIISILVIVAILVLGVASVFAAGTDYPTKPITLICPVNPGGNHDLTARMFQSVAEKYLGQPVVVVNKPGATGTIGMLEALKAPADGYTLAEPGESENAKIEWEKINGRKPPYVMEDFITIGSWTKMAPLVVVPYNSPWKTLGDMIKDLKAKPDEYAFCSGGTRGSSHLPIELLMNVAEFKARHVPFQGGGPCLSSLAGGHEHFATQFPLASIPLAQGKKIRILAVVGNERISALPDVPTCKELGVDASYYQWVGLAFKKGTPQPIVDKLRDVFKKVMADPQYIKLMQDAGSEVRPMFGDDLTQYMQTEKGMFVKLYEKMLKAEKK